MIDHISVAVRDLVIAERFYTAVLAPLGLSVKASRSVSFSIATARRGLTEASPGIRGRFEIHGCQACNSSSNAFASFEIVETFRKPAVNRSEQFSSKGLLSPTLALSPRGHALRLVIAEACRCLRRPQRGVALRARDGHMGSPDSERDPAGLNPP
jgi:catechol 2,3-dioxygenase-like lactoylglutathione lyase family enzyme